MPLRKFPGMAGESLIDGGDVGSCFPMPAQSKYCHEKVLLEKGDGSTFGRERHSADMPNKSWEDIKVMERYGREGRYGRFNMGGK